MEPRPRVPHSGERRLPGAVARPDSPTRRSHVRAHAEPPDHRRPPALVGTGRPAHRRGDEPPGCHDRAGRRARGARRPGWRGVRRAVVQRRVHAAVRAAADHRRAAGGHRRAPPGVPCRGHRVRARVAGLCAGPIRRAAHRRARGAGRDGGGDHPADVRADHRHVLRPRANQGAGLDRPGDGARGGVRTGARRRADPRRPVRFVLARGVPGEPATGRRRARRRAAAVRGPSTAPAPAGRGRYRPGRVGYRADRLPADRHRLGRPAGLHRDRAGRRRRGARRVRCTAAPGRSARTESAGGAQPVRPPRLPSGTGGICLVLRGVERVDAGHRAVPAARSGCRCARRRVDPAAMVGRHGDLVVGGRLTAGAPVRRAADVRRARRTTGRRAGHRRRFPSAVLRATFRGPALAAAGHAGHLRHRGGTVYRAVLHRRAGAGTAPGGRLGGRAAQRRAAARRHPRRGTARQRLPARPRQRPGQCDRHRDRSRGRPARLLGRRRAARRHRRGRRSDDRDAPAAPSAGRAERRPRRPGRAPAAPTGPS